MANFIDKFRSKAEFSSKAPSPRRALTGPNSQQLRQAHCLRIAVTKQLVQHVDAAQVMADRVFLGHADAAMQLDCQLAQGPCLAADEEEQVHGPGWFDSSWELESGLDVREGLPGDARLNEWLTVCLRA